MLQVGAEDPMVLTAAVEELVAAAADATAVRWSLRGFRRTAAAARDPDATPATSWGRSTAPPTPPRTTRCSTGPSPHGRPTTPRTPGWTAAATWSCDGSACS